MSDNYTIDDDRIAAFGNAIIGTIEEFQRDHYDGKVTVEVTRGETLIALMSLLSFQIASIDCRDCRHKLGGATRREIDVLIKRAIVNPVGPDEPHHHTH